MFMGANYSTGAVFHATPADFPHLTHSYYKNSYVTIAFNVARPFCRMDVSQWLQNLNESVTNVQNVACICRNNSYNIYIPYYYAQTG